MVGKFLNISWHLRKNPTTTTALTESINKKLKLGNPWVSADFFVSMHEFLVKESTAHITFVVCILCWLPIYPQLKTFLESKCIDVKSQRF